MNYSLFSAFLLITFVLVIVPGPIVTLVIATAATRGTRAALITVIGTTLGTAVMLLCIALGLNWVLKTSAEVFEVLRWIGAAYLIWLQPYRSLVAHVAFGLAAGVAGLAAQKNGTTTATTTDARRRSN